MRVYLLASSVIVASVHESHVHASSSKNHNNPSLYPYNRASNKNSQIQNTIPLAFSSNLPSDIAQSAKKELLSYSQKISAESKTGAFVYDAPVKQQLKKLSVELEAVCDNPTMTSQQLMVGDWKLICTTASPSQDFFNGMSDKPKKRN